MTPPADSAAARLDPAQALGLLLEPSGWAPFSCLEPPAALRALVPLIRQLDDAALTPEQRAARNLRIAANTLGLGFGPRAPRRVVALVRRHLRLQALRRAEELLFLQGDIERLYCWGIGKAVVPAPGIAHAAALAASGRGVVVVSAHLGPLAYYAPLLAIHLTAAGGPLPTVLLSVVNAPSSPRLQQRLSGFSHYHSVRLEYLVKEPGHELGLLRRLVATVEQGGWVLLQLDVLSGGSNQQPLPLAGQEVRLPGAWGAARLAVARQVPLLPVRATRRSGGKPGLLVEAPLHPSPSAMVQPDAIPEPRGGRAGRHDTAVALLATALAARLECWLRSDLADWALLPQLHLLAAGPTSGG